MTARFLKILMILVAVIFLILGLLRGFTYWFWSEGDIDATLKVFQQKSSSFQSLVLWAGEKKSQACIRQYQEQACLPEPLQEITQAHFSVSDDPFIVEAAPVNFYYVLVYTKEANEVKKSEVYRDEGSILQQVAPHWTLVRRGWM